MEAPDAGLSNKLVLAAMAKVNIVSTKCAFYFSFGTLNVRVFVFFTCDMAKVFLNHHFVINAGIRLVTSIFCVIIMI